MCVSECECVSMCVSECEYLYVWCVCLCECVCVCEYVCLWVSLSVCESQPMAITSNLFSPRPVTDSFLLASPSTTKNKILF